MENQIPEEHLKEIARQLSCPDGAHGIKTGEMMNVSNIGMTTSAIEALNLKANNVVLELGHGNAAHVANVLNKAENVTYFGADISKTIITEAERINAKFIAEYKASFFLTNGETLPFEDKIFDKIFTVNTIYFWQNPTEYLKEIKRVLKPTGSLTIAFADKTFMETLPFTKFGFNLYDEQRVLTVLETSGFKVLKSTKNNEEINSNAGFMVSRDYYVISAVCT
ncbi:class I SAM-dependent methyltransferase [Pedobacter aquatilis]|uniref:class I SAM-dependent methyltransferase n=1 Tax=Pedobacter aquatilis TaxID=351343 RepID=UPI0025B40DD0|nr:class I SAM-dependent methyltransferase [Pedobacter aquatilis]MDN3586659.1 class I SAM-dependent methyltransferase [Pedobacter aquatilis]